jgi:hypothetical protein
MHGADLPAPLVTSAAVEPDPTQEEEEQPGRRRTKPATRPRHACATQLFGACLAARYVLGHELCVYARDDGKGGWGRDAEVPAEECDGAGGAWERVHQPRYKLRPGLVGWIQHYRNRLSE